MTAVTGSSSNGPVDDQYGPAARLDDVWPAGDVDESGAELRPVVSAPPATDDQRVDAALAELAAAVQAPVADQVAAYVGAHRALHERLADLDS